MSDANRGVVVAWWCALQTLHQQKRRWTAEDGNDWWLVRQPKPYYRMSKHLNCLECPGSTDSKPASHRRKTDSWILDGGWRMRGSIVLDRLSGFDQNHIAEKKTIESWMVEVGWVGMLVLGQVVSFLRNWARPRRRRAFQIPKKNTHFSSLYCHNSFFTDFCVP